MNFDWKIFEEVKEYVYVADMDTYEVVYMNKILRDAVGCAPEYDYSNERCYSLLQGKGEPCEFCSNARLKEDEIYRWIFFNPVLKKAMMLQDTLIQKDGRRYRLEIACENEKDLSGGKANIYMPNEILVNECLQSALNAEDYTSTFNNLLSYIGNKFQCARVYIFEFKKNQTFSNTYEWCAPGVISQKELLQNEPLDMITSWIRMFQDNQMVIIEKLESIRKTYPAVYATLKPQGVKSLIACPLRYQDTIIGFLGIDNPENEQISQILSFFRVMEYFVVMFLKRRDLSYRLAYISYHDQLTGALNRTAYKENEENLQRFETAGVVYGDITGLKRMNDQFGHLEGDKLIRKCYGMLAQAFGEHRIYRTGGDEFLVICINISRENFRKKYGKLQKLIDNADCNMAIGAAWGDSEEENLQSMITLAEERMYEEKKKFYARRNLVGEESYEKHLAEREISSMGFIEPARKLQEFLRQNPDSIEPMIRAASDGNSTVFLYIGDMKENTYYISDNMKELFGFDSNVVEDLGTKWERRICHEEDLEHYRQDIKEVLEKKKKEHDFKYRVYDRNGRLRWIHCRGTLYWDEEGKTPLYFAGCITMQEFLIDPVTSFPKEKDAVIKLKELKEKDQHTIVLGIGLNHFAELNETKGRGVTDNFLRDITQHWENKFSHKIWLYRLDGIRFMGIVHPEKADQVEQLVDDIRESVINLCHKYHILIKYPCSICVFRYPDDIEKPEVFSEKIVTFIEAAKNNIDRKYICYSEDEQEIFRSQAEYILHLNEDVMNEFQNFRIVIQPIVSAEENNCVTGGEVLLRWRCMGRDIPPAVFIPLLEKKGLICQVGRWVFEQSVRHCRRIVADYPDFRLSFNVSYLQISDEGFIDFMRDTFAKYGVSGSSMILELTESHFDDDPEQLMKFVKECRELGLAIALDDFGQGYSSLKLLLKYPANLVKLDRSLLMELANSPNKQKFLKTMVFACHEFGKEVCVEGVETKTALEIIEKTDGDMIQGFYFYHPLELEEFYKTLHK